MTTATRAPVDDAEAVRLAGVLAGVDLAYGDAVRALVLRLIEERNQARSIAVRLEQETGALHRALDAALSGHPAVARLIVRDHCEPF